MHIGQAPILCLHKLQQTIYVHSERYIHAVMDIFKEE